MTAPPPMDLSVILLHDKMVDKRGSLITTSLTMIDLHDIARTCRTYGITNVFIAHPAASLRKLARTLKSHWEGEFGTNYNPNRKEALEYVEIVSCLDEAIAKIDVRTGSLPRLIATSAKPGGKRKNFQQTRSVLTEKSASYLLMFGTGWGMSDDLLARADIFLEPVHGPTPYNHLSVRSACAIILDRLLAPPFA